MNKHKKIDLSSKRLQFGQIGFLGSASAVLLSKQLICLGLIWARRERVRLETRQNSRIISAVPGEGLAGASVSLSRRTNQKQDFSGGRCGCLGYGERRSSCSNIRHQDGGRAYL